MKKLQLFACAAVAVALGACTESANPVLNIDGGKVQGVLCDSTDVIVYKGIPYAAPPVGELRWKKPQPVVPWDTVLIANDFRNASVQAAHDPNDGAYGTEFFATDAPFSEDCLYLNVWTPKSAAGNPSAKLPVAMWIHGGAYTGGWSFEPEMDGEAWAERGVILVTINYRLGVFGFLNHPLLTEEGGGHSGNYGTYDQAAALTWIQRNIDQFGGDPDNITVFGQSAGAASVKNMVISPMTKGMVKKAIIQSIGGISGVFGDDLSQASLDAKAKAKYDAAGLTSLEQLRAASWEELTQAAGNAWVDTTAVSFRPHNDGVLLVEDFNTAAFNNSLADVPYMIGSCANDMPGLAEGIQRFAEVRDSLSQQPTFVYFFDRPLPTDGRKSLEGSFHSSELWYVFHTLGRSWRPFTPADYELSNQMVDYWTNFCKYGNPNGPAEGDWAKSTKSAPFVKTLKVSE